jgi:hypothetical protein
MKQHASVKQDYSLLETVHVQPVMPAVIAQCARQPPHAQVAKPKTVLKL